MGLEPRVVVRIPVIKMQHGRQNARPVLCHNQSSHICLVPPSTHRQQRRSTHPAQCEYHSTQVTSSHFHSHPRLQFIHKIPLLWLDVLCQLWMYANSSCRWVVSSGHKGAHTLLYVLPSLSQYHSLSPVQITFPSQKIPCSSP